MYIYLSDIDLRNNKLYNIVIHPTGGTPSTAVTGQLFYRTDLGSISYYDTINDQWVFINNRFDGLIEGIYTGGTLQIGDGGRLTYTGTGEINANLFQDNSVIPVSLGGTDNTSFIPGGILIGNGSSAIMVDTTGLFFDVNNNRLGLNFTAPSATLHIGTGLNITEPFMQVQPRYLKSVPSANTFEFTGTGLYYNDHTATRYKFATTSDSLTTNFTGILPINKGGTNARKLAENSLVYFDGTVVTGIIGGAISGEIPEWNGAGWTVSSGKYVSLQPTSSLRNVIQPNNPNTIPFAISGASGQAVEVFKLTKWNNNTVLTVSGDGSIYTKGSISVTGAIYAGTINSIGLLNGYSTFYIQEGSNTNPSIQALNGKAAGINISGQLVSFSFANSSFSPGTDGTSVLDVTSSGTFIQNTPLVWVSGSSRLNVSFDSSKVFNNNIYLPTGNNGTIALISQIPTGLTSLQDISFGPLVSGNYLRYNGNYWINATGDGGGPGGASAFDDLTDVTITSAASGQVIRYNGSQWVNVSGISKYTAILTAGATGYNVFHNLNTYDVISTIYENTGRYPIIYPSIENLSTSGIYIGFGSITTVDHKVVILG